jgi:hypothetical protein
MNKKHTVRLGAIIGLLVGVIIFAVGFVLPPDIFLRRAIVAMQSPLIPIVNLLQPASQPWGSNNDIYKVWIAILCYWMLFGLLLGVLVGSSYRLFVGQKDRRAA